MTKVKGILFWGLAVSAVCAYADPVLVPAPRMLQLRPGVYACGSNGLSAVAACYRQDASLKPEGYRLSVTTGGVEIVHADEAGAFYARQTLRQLLEGDGSSLPCCEIEDWPEYGWRGVHFDDSRHFFGRETLKGVLDLMAQHKLNVLHWHLTDDQGWRLEIPGYPELARYAARRPESPVHGELLKGSVIGQRTIPTNGQPYGPYIYTEEDVRDIVAYAAERQITIVPEIELPGHFAAVLAAYPEFACVPENFARRSPRCIWGIEKDVLCVGNDRALKFVDDVLSYVCRIFPGKFVHIGGDECPVDRWRECPKCQKRCRAEGLKDEHGLQPWVTRRAERLLKERGKRIVGWDEYLVGDIPKDAVGMIWHTRKPRNDHDFLPADQAVKRGHDVVMTPHNKTYFYYRQGIPDDPFLYGGGLVTLECAYGFDPAAYVPAEYRNRLLGGQCCNWSEYTWNEYDLAWKLWPRGCAIAETLWTGSAKPGYDDFLRRMRSHRRRLLRQGVNCAPLPPFADYGGTVPAGR